MSAAVEEGDRSNPGVCTLRYMERKGWAVINRRLNLILREDAMPW